MARLFKWCACRHPRLAHWCRVAYAVALVGAIFMSGAATGSLVAWSKAQDVIKAQREDYQASLDLLTGKVVTAATASKDAASKAAAAAETAKSATQTAQEAAATAKTAARAAGQAGTAASAASTKAGRAAAVAQDAAGALDRALSQPAPPPADVPDWLNTP